MLTRPHRCPREENGLTWCAGGDKNRARAAIRMPDTKPTTAVVLVLGDVGRSPRMQYHALSLSQSNTSHVYLVGYRGERAVPAVGENAKITQVLISPDLLPKPRMRALYLLFLPLKAILLLFQVLWTLLFRLQRATFCCFKIRRPCPRSPQRGLCACCAAALSSSLAQSRLLDAFMLCAQTIHLSASRIFTSRSLAGCSMATCA